MSLSFKMPEMQDEAQYLQYRSLSGLAVASLVLALLGATAFLYAPMAVVALAAAVTGIGAVRRIRRRRHELTGLAAAWAGLLVGATGCAGSIAYHVYQYRTEVPPDHIRITFADLQPDPEHPELPVPPSALQLDGKKVFLKGFVYPTERKTGIQHFILVPDMGTCCFGGQPKLTDMVEVTLRDPLRINYSFRRRSLSGILHVTTRKKPLKELDGVYYQLDAYDWN